MNIFKPVLSRSLYLKFMGSMLLCTTMLLSSCVSIPPIQNTTDLSKVDFSKVSKFKRGESCATYLLGIIPFGASRITGAVKDGKIKRVKVLEYETRNYLIVSQFCVVAYGV